MSERTCTHCDYTGELNDSGYLDCTNCGAADERVALINFIAAEVGNVTLSDLYWLIHLRAVKLAQKETK